MEMIQFNMNVKNADPIIEGSFFKNKNAEEIATAMCRKCKGDTDLAIKRLVNCIPYSDTIDTKIREAVKILHDLSKQEELNKEV
jgi:transcription elongation factor Elf1